MRAYDANRKRGERTDAVLRTSARIATTRVAIVQLIAQRKATSELPPTSEHQDGCAPRSPRELRRPPRMLRARVVRRASRRGGANGCCVYYAHRHRHNFDDPTRQRGMRDGVVSHPRSLPNVLLVRRIQQSERDRSTRKRRLRRAISEGGGLRFRRLWARVP